MDDLYAPPREEAAPSWSSEAQEGPPLADLGQRFLARLLDNVAFCALGAGPVLASGGVGREPAAVAGLAVAAVLLGAFLTVQLVFLATSGQTVGKRAVGIQVLDVHTHGAVPLWRILVLRGLVVQAAGVMPFVGSLFSLVDILLIFRSDRRCLHDHIASTRVCAFQGRYADLA